MTGLGWSRICALDDVYPDSGGCALVDGRQIAVFRVRDAVYAIDNRDPASGANVLARGIVGDLDGEPMVASPLYKQHFSLITGRCLEEPVLRVAVHDTRIDAGELWIRLGMAGKARAGRRRLIVIGNGPAAMRTLEELLELAPEAYDITVFGGEPRPAYNRVLLSALLSGQKRLEELITHGPEWFAQQGIALHAGDPIVRIDRRRRRVHSQQGVELDYDRLLIATGSKPVRLTVPGCELPGVMRFRDLEDVEAMLSAARRSRHAIVIGGGLLGLEAADGLARRGLDVTVLHLRDTLMNRQLDTPAATLLRAQLEARGLKFVLSARTIEICGTDRANGVRLEDGIWYSAELIVIAIGVEPNIALAQAAGLRCERGIVVDDTLQTFDPALYAVGECVQHRGSTYGMVAPLWDQARVCAAHLADRGVRRYRGSPPATQLKIEGVELFAAGNCVMGRDTESLVLRDPQRGVYKHLLIEQDRMRGALLFGDTRDSGWYSDLIREGRPIGTMRDHLIFGAPAEAVSGGRAA